MKGLVFTTYYDFCERRFGAELLEDVIDGADLPNGGAYTSVGTYPFEEMVALVTTTARLTGLALPGILEAFGEHCFASWVSYMPAQFRDKDLFDILAGVDEFHESEVRKLYPDAELPSFQVASRTDEQIVLHYRSCKPLADLAAGVIRGAADHLGCPVAIRHQPGGGADAPFVRFEIDRI